MSDDQRCERLLAFADSLMADKRELWAQLEIKDVQYRLARFMAYLGWLLAIVGPLWIIFG